MQIIPIKRHSLRNKRRNTEKVNCNKPFAESVYGFQEICKFLVASSLLKSMLIKRHYYNANLGLLKHKWLHKTKTYKTCSL